MEKNKIAWILMIFGGLSAFLSISIMEQQEFSVAKEALEMNVQQHGSFILLKIWFAIGVVSLMWGIILGYKKLNR
ncbi:MAG: hypothetical protein WBD24_06715 [Candidatus Omnitrophota bacterium]